MSAGILVVDRRSGSTMAAHNEHGGYRSASLVKLSIALDYLESRPRSDISAEDRMLLDSMLRSSDDAAASELWVRGDQQEIILRVARRLGLADTQPPDAPGMWGYTATSAADIARTYRYILGDIPGTDRPEFRELVLRALRNWTRRASDGSDQSFGIPRAMSVPRAVKQGWSGFDGRMPTERPTTGELDLTRHAMHTSGTVGYDDERIIVVLTLHPANTSWETCADRVTEVTRALDRVTSSRG